VTVINARISHESLIAAVMNIHWLISPVLFNMLLRNDYASTGMITRQTGVLSPRHHIRFIIVIKINLISLFPVSLQGLNSTSARQNIDTRLAYIIAI
jgi:hypothetical protein